MWVVVLVSACRVAVFMYVYVWRVAVLMYGGLAVAVCSILVGLVISNDTHLLLILYSFC